MRIRAAAEVGGGDEFVTCAQNIRDGEVDCRRAAGERQRRRAAFELRQALLEDVVGRVHQACVDVAELSQGEEVGAVLGVSEAERRGPIYGDGAGLRGGFGNLSCMEGKGFDVVLFVAHGRTSEEKDEI
jgi:hypothetical protein